MFKAIIFDIDGTLVDTEKGDLQALKETLQDEGLTYSIDELRFVFGIPSKYALEHFPVSDTEQVLKKWMHKEANYSKNAKPFSGIEDVMKQLFNSKCKTALVTSKTREEYQNYFAKMELNSFFELAVVADDTQTHKPNPEPMLYCLEKINVLPSEAIYIGDTIYDQECAKAAGAKFGLALWGAHTSDGFDADYIFESPDQILKLIT